MDMEKNIIKIFQEELNIIIDDIDEELKMYGIDSLQLIQIIVSIEETFDIEFPDDKLRLENVSSVRKIANLVDGMLKSAI